jgi:glycosyltransferase involved in cell wall biosynthesis
VRGRFLGFPLVSVIVPTLNSSETISRCLHSIRSQTYESIELIVVDGSSVDKTVDIAQSYNALVISTKTRNRSIQRNIGSRSAQGDFLLYIDSDEVLNPNLVKDCVNKAKFSAGIFISTIDVGFSYFGKSRSLGDVVHVKFDNRINNSSSVLRFISKQLFIQVNGYDPKLVIGEDVVFALKSERLGRRLGRSRYPILHFGTEGLKNMLLKKIFYGSTFGSFERESSMFNYFPYVSYLEAAGFLIKNLFKCKSYLRYLPGYFVVKCIEFCGLFIGTKIATDR